MVSMLLPPQVSKYLGEGFDLFFHGNRIPPWFTFRSRRGKPIYLSYSKDVCYNKIRGYEACLVFKPGKNFDARVSYHSLSCTIRYSMHDYDYDSIGERVQERYGYLMTDEFSVESTRIDGLHLIWLFYSKCNMLPVSFHFSSVINSYFKVNGCGVRLVWDEDVQQEMDLSTTQEYWSY
ncbi:hypothetical protein L6452_08848 [Arctium lappa]|uniref:Uncharacterized protein n=1 Tax=Arctium lappa TaxID=4217 RepID=A0ACB9DIR3_ARCLA|nr:hypothetical protein L6452_08848 [Arctium lappa]